jgi:Ca2+-binding RTX toxin-like protein
MAGYVFNTMSASDAAAFTANDTLTFTGINANQVRVEPYTNGSSGGSNSGISVTATVDGASKTLVFSDAFATASVQQSTTSTTVNGNTTTSTTGQIVFADNSHLEVGHNASADTITPFNVSDAHTVFGLGGNDTINFANTNPGVSEYLNGGFGGDTIMGGNANNHIWGNSEFAQQGATDPSSNQVDGADTITVLGGSNYINGNAGNDTITAGTNATAANATTGTSAAPASNGANHISGGGDNDTINILGAGHNTVNGNMGNDTITDTGNGDNTLRGGQGNDTITGGSGHSVLMGDVGNDTIIIHGNNNENVSTGASNTFSTAHIDVITGGDGADTFNFSAAGAGQAVKFGQVTYYQEITDFTHGVDKMVLPTTAMNSSGNTGAVVGTSSTVFSTVHDAEAYANTLLNGQGVAGATPTVEALSVGSANNTFLFYLDNTTQPTGTNEVAGLGVVHLDNVTASTLTATDFISG